jgi:hypothetical protein
MDDMRSHRRSRDGVDVGQACAYKRGLFGLVFDIVEREKGCAGGGAVVPFVLRI